MKVLVDEGTCIGCGLCEQLCQAVFQMEGDVAKVKVDPVPSDQQATCREAADSCPVEAIAIED